MAVSILLCLYVILCLTAAVLGRKTRIGFVGSLAISILFTPFWVFLGILFFSQRASKDKDKDKDKEKSDRERPRLD